jgi:hypothetical protein
MPAMTIVSPLPVIGAEHAIPRLRVRSYILALELADVFQLAFEFRESPFAVVVEIGRVLQVCEFGLNA